ncbi:putative metal-dependent HD superfamily phosphohydrolase [Knoellia remsis]|uniref:Putative metal-dependent HD superfamily phosphohydrolase n=1 Tax=Knoellia remsis TaxID=407159 RepID=A0A2T0TTY6_9MICO|nr:metal-dependent phosphohydrolase [Knoellia remsis]PRY49113.1 putative metal-dependent HD superfamily phosphohydrolase [Knoellia remsis]
MRRDEVWDEAVRITGGDAAGLATVRADLLRRWSEPHRDYHDLRHLDEVLAALTELRPSALDDDLAWAAVVFAAWFHDAVYDATAPEDNERASAEMARDALSRCGVDSATVELVGELVEESATHDVTQTRGPRATFHDADLWILAAPLDRFDDYCSAVRREYADVPDDAYAAGRAAILGPFLDRADTYRTEHARRRWEPRARANLRVELDRLSGSR